MPKKKPATDEKKKKIKILSLKERILHQADAIPPEKRYPFRCAGLDFATNGGVPKGLISLFHGGPGYGKTTMALLAMAECLRQEKKQKGVCIRSDYKWDTAWYRDLGGDPSRVFVEDGDNLEVIFDLIRGQIKDLTVAFCCVDSLRAMTTSAQYDRDFTEGPGQMSPEATVTNKFFRDLNEDLAIRRQKGNPFTIIIINHESIVPPTFVGGFPSKTVPYGKQQMFANHMRLEVVKPTYSIDHTEFSVTSKVIVTIRIKVKRNIQSPSESTGFFDLYQMPDKYPKGTIDDFSHWWEMGKKCGYIVGHDGEKQTPAWTMGDDTPINEQSKDVIQTRWVKNRELYHKDQDIILPRVVELFGENLMVEAQPEPLRLKTERKRYKGTDKSDMVDERLEPD